MHYPDGQSFVRTLRGVRPYLQGVQATPPTSVMLKLPASAPAAALATVGLFGMPQSVQAAPWCLESVGSLLAVHAQLMPGDWSLSHIAALATFMSHVNSGRVCVHDKQHVLSSCEFVLLERVLQTDAWGRMCDPFCVQPELPLDVLYPSFWSSLMVPAGCRPEVVVCRPNSAVLDIMLPLMTQYVPCVCVLVPYTYLTCAPQPRVAWLQQLQSSNRLHVVKGSSSQHMGSQQCMVWLCVFQTATCRFQNLRAAYRSAECVSYVYM